MAFTTNKLTRAAAATAAIALLAGGLAACSGDDPNAGSSPDATTTDTGSADPSASPSADATVNYSDEGMPTVTGKFGEKPTLKYPDGDAPSDLRVAVVQEGTGEEVKKGDLVAIDYLGQVWGGGADAFDNSYDTGRPFPVTVGAGQVIAGWDAVLPGMKVGERAIVSIPAALGYGPSGGSEQAGIGADDTIVFVMDVVSILDAKIVANATPTDNPLPAGVSVDGDLGEAATIAVADGTPEPTEETVTVVAEGSGDKLTANDVALVSFSAVTWANEAAGDTWTDAGGPQSVTVGEGSAFAGLVGIPVGSRVVLTVPANADTSSPAFAVVVDLIAGKIS